ncbi:hypothetical protein [Roseateles sp. P5_E11]
MKPLFTLLAICPRKAAAIACSLAAVLFPGHASSMSFSENFDSGLPNSQLSTFATAPGFSLSLSGGKAFMTQAAETPNGVIALSTRFFVEGDFSVTVTANRVGLGSAEAGLNAIFGSSPEVTGTADVFFVRQSGINANIVAGHSQTSGITSLNATDAILRIRRVGTTVFDEVDTGSGFVTLHTQSDSAFAKPAQFELFLIQEFGSTAINQASFDNWIIVADSISAVPETSSWALLACGLMAMWGFKTIGQRRSSAGA